MRVMSAARGPAARARSATSGPMPRGSPTVTASRGRLPLEPDVDVRVPAQALQVVLQRLVLGQPVADA